MRPTVAAMILSCRTCNPACRMLIQTLQIRFKWNAGLEMPRTLEDFAIFAAPGIFVVLWASGFIGAKFGLPYAEPMTFLSLRMIAAVLLLLVVIVFTRPEWPAR